MTSLEIKLFKDTCAVCIDNQDTPKYAIIPNHGGPIKFDMNDRLKTTIIKESCPQPDPKDSGTQPDPSVVSHRDVNVGASNYAKYKIQPWDIWLEYGLNPWDADIIKRILRTKVIGGMTPTEARLEDYEKIKHICDERIAQLNGAYDV